MKCYICETENCESEACADIRDPRVQAIRNDDKVGWGSCTSVDECWSAGELVDVFEEEGITTPEEAVKWAYWMENLHNEQALNCRWGEDTDPELNREEL